MGYFWPSKTRSFGRDISWDISWFHRKKPCAKTGISCPSWGSSDCTSTGLNRGPLASEKPCFSSWWLLKPGSSYWSQLGMAKILVKRQVRQFFAFQFYQLDVRQKPYPAKIVLNENRAFLHASAAEVSLTSRAACWSRTGIRHQPPSHGGTPSYHPLMAFPWHRPSWKTSGFRLLVVVIFRYKLQRSWVCQSPFGPVNL